LGDGSGRSSTSLAIVRFDAAPAARSSAEGTGEIDYRIARQVVVTKYRNGEVSAAELCVAHPELRRNARECGVPMGELCPICEEDEAVIVSYVFGPRLPKHGRCLSAPDEIDKIRQRKGTFTCYEVEACPTCSWNHLRRRFTINGR
jgi:hypothetical protein